MKYILATLAFLLPLHALIITFLKCKIGINTDLIRFWKEGIIIVLLAVASFVALKKSKYKISKIYKNNNLIGYITLFIITSLIYIFFPFFQVKLSSLLGFKYDVFFLFALIIGIYLIQKKEDLIFILKSLFASIGLILILFLPWYLFGDISLLTTIFGYSSEVSTYNANGCISFAQNVEGQHRFQATFGGPIRFSVFLVNFFIIWLGFVLNNRNSPIPNPFPLQEKGNKIILSPEGGKYPKGDWGIKKYLLIIIPSLLVITSIFFSYSKTTILGLVFGIILFIYLISKIIYKKKLNKKLILILAGLGTIPILLVALFKRDLFLHLGSVLNRFDNLGKSVEMFFYNPIGYGLGIAGPASQIGNSIESVGNVTIAATAVGGTYKFLPENWYIQIILEQGIIGLFLFIGILIIIGLRLYKIILLKKDYLSIAIFTSFITLCFMANFTHAFEESATSYILFLIIGGYLAVNGRK